MENTTMRDALESAINDAEEETTTETTEVKEDETTETQENTESEKSEKPESGKPADTTERSDEEKAGEKTDTEKQKPVEKTDVPHGTKAPQSWNPAEREEWGKLPANIQSQILKREQETFKALAETGEARETAKNFNQMMQPYQGMFAAQGVDPIKGTNDILQTVAMLQGGTSQQKVGIIANLIQSYGIDVSSLDNQLVGKAAPASQIPPEIQQELQTMRQYIEQQKTHQNQAEQQHRNQAVSEVEQFVKSHEFAQDLRGVMADFSQMASQMGKPISLDEAYNRALATRPDIQKIISSRGSIQTNQQNLDKARQASVSLAQNGAVEVAKESPTDLRGALEFAMANAG